MPNFELKFLADKVYVHRWPQDSPAWDNYIQKQLDESINKNPEKKQVIIDSELINIQSMEFHSLKKIGITVPPFKDECTLIFEGKFGGFSSHVHITIKCDNYLEVFNNLISWRKQFF